MVANDMGCLTWDTTKELSSVACERCKSRHHQCYQ